VSVPSQSIPNRTVTPSERERDPARHVVMRHVDQRIAAVAHLSIGFGVVIGVGFLLGIAINVFIWLRSKRSSFVELHAEEAGTYQLAVLVINLLMAAGWIAALGLWMGSFDFFGLGSLSFTQVFTAMLCLLPFALVWYFGTIFYGVYAGLVVASGRDFSYPIIGPWIRRRLAARAASRAASSPRA
jgi:uncharacterized Tic20 family protein